MAAVVPKRQYTVGEEIASAVTHGLGAVLAIVALITLIVVARTYGTLLHVVSVTVYGSTLVLLYLASTLYHSLSNTRACKVFKIIDHASIYLLIAGTYTPFTLLTLHGPAGWSLLATVWVLAIAGVALEAFWVYRPKWLSGVVYLAMGWLVIVAVKPLLAGLPPHGWQLLLAGGLAYTFGVVFYVLKKVPYMHAVWHLWVLAGSAFHFFAIVLYVLPGKA